MLEYWVILPRPKELQIYLLQENSETPARTLSGSDLLETPLLSGLQIPLPEIFEE